MIFVNLGRFAPRERGRLLGPAIPGDAGIGVGWLGEIGYQLAVDQGSSGMRE
jgi:hypothetical protein